MQEEERQAARWLDEEMQENLSSRVEDVGGSSRDGSIRGKLAEERDVTMARLVKKGLEMHPRQDRANRPGYRGMNCQQHGFKLFLDRTQISLVPNFQKQLRPPSVFLLQLALTSLAKLSEELKWLISMARQFSAQLQLEIITGSVTTLTR